MNTKRYGNIGEAVAISLFVKHCIPVYLPFGDNERSDLIAEFGGRLNKIQVKTAVNSNNGSVVFDLTSSTSHRTGGHKHKYSKNEVDYFFCYNVDRDKSYLVKVPEEPISSIRIRFEDTKNSQVNNINHERDYLFEYVLDKVINGNAVERSEH